MHLTIGIAIVVIYSGKCYGQLYDVQYSCYTSCLCNNTSVECSDLRPEQVNVIATQIPANTTHLSFVSCKLVDFPWTYISRITALKELDLTSNFLTVFPGINNISHFFPNLSVLRVSQNALTELSFQRLAKLPLKKLYANGNQINLIYSVFNTFTEIEELHLDGNQLSHLPSFNGFTKLKVLNLMENVLKQIKRNTFEGLGNLAILNVSLNSIAYIEGGALNHFKDESIAISFAFNSLTRIQKGFFDSLKTFQSISVEGNEISTLEENIFKGIKATDDTIGINLQNNALETLPIDTLCDIKSGVILLYGNPIQCNCDVYKLQNRLKSNTNISINGSCFSKYSSRILDSTTVSFDSNLSEICPPCETQNFSSSCASKKENVCYTCSCFERNYNSGQCFLPNDTIRECNCSSFTSRPRNNGTVPDRRSNATAWIVIGALITIVVFFVLFSFPMHTYFRRRVKRKHLRKISDYRKRLISRSTSTSKSESKGDSENGNLPGTSHDDQHDAANDDVFDDDSNEATEMVTHPVGKNVSDMKPGTDDEKQPETNNSKSQTNSINDEVVFLE